jgi:hypothetical protein
MVEYDDLAYGARRRLKDDRPAYAVARLSF